ncbi:MAG: hypothetical protein IJ689_07215, partial [Alphaproteobacteria bacterium]|nr:hypothetical protein [Alphaproteobacteria bacterium]
RGTVLMQCLCFAKYERGSNSFQEFILLRKLELEALANCASVKPIVSALCCLSASRLLTIAIALGKNNP